jgi:hypothetical protein
MPQLAVSLIFDLSDKLRADEDGIPLFTQWQILLAMPF